MKNNVLDNPLAERDCTGCSMCSVVCPKDAITIELTHEGFYEPTIDNSLCIGCGICKKVCYKFDEKVDIDTKEHYSCYSAINKDANELKTATSGGVSNELMKSCIGQGYKVVGVAYDYDKEIAITRIATKIEELDQFKGSKYFQSYTADAFKEIVADKTDQKYAIFGTPCQIYAISKYTDLKKNRDRFILVDLFCHGCPSMNLWTKYLEYSKDKFNTSKFNKIEFRSKVHGWHEFGFKFATNEKTFKNSKTNDEFYELFFDMNTHNKACYECRMRSSLEFTDIRIGDFWGHQYDLDTRGVSAIVLCSDKADELFAGIKHKIEVSGHMFSDVIAAQSYGKLHECNQELRKYTLELLSSEMSMEEVIKVYQATYCLKKKIRIKIKNLFKSLPQALYLNIKKIKHKV